MRALGHWDIAEGGSLAAARSLPEEFIRWRDSSGPLVISRRASRDGFCYSLHLGTDLVVEALPGQRLVTNARPGLPDVTVDHFIRDQVAPRVLAHEGHFVLHAAGIRHGEGMILLMGKTGRGKSTLATSFDLNGCALLGDDAMIIDLAGKPHARAVYPSLRLLPDSIAALFPMPVATTSIAHYSDKQRIALPDVPETPSLPVKAMFVLAEPQADGQIAVERMAPAPACVALLANSFALDPADLGRARERLDCAGILASAIPVFELRYPRDYARLQEVRQAMLDTLGSEPAQ